jgi:L-malate glycosyltransferase
MKRNVLHLIGSFNIGGSERQAVQLVRLMAAEKSVNVFAACLSREGPLLADINSLGLPEIHEYPLNSFYDLNFLVQLKRFVSFLRTNDIDIIQTHDFYTNVFGMTAGALARVPVRIAAKRETGTRTPKQAFLERRAFGLAQKIAANADTVRRHLIACGVRAEKVVTIYNGLDPAPVVSESFDSTEIYARLGLRTGTPAKIVTIVANLRSEVKNHRMFLRAAASVKKVVDNTVFVVAGEGELTEEIKNFATGLEIGDSVIFTGRCDYVSELLSISDVCVLSSVTEGFSNSILEYMAAGNPVVATNVGGAAEAVVEGETGYLVASDDDFALSERIARLLTDDSLAREFGARGRQRIEEHFSGGARLKKTLALYDELFNTPRGTNASMSGEQR